MKQEVKTQSEIQISKYNTIAKIIDQLEECGYECEGGPLINNVAFLALKGMAETHPSADIFDMANHEIADFQVPPYFRVMKVHTGWLYNFWSDEAQSYGKEWTFVPLTQ